jgi:plasmid stability protein
MALLQVRSFPDDIYNELTILARSEHRSVAQQTIVLLRSALGEQEQRKKKRQEFLRSLLEEKPVMTGDYPSAAELIREDRER